MKNDPLFSPVNYCRKQLNLTKKIADFKSENYWIHVQIDVYLVTDSKEPMQFNKTNKAQLHHGSRVGFIDLIMKNPYNSRWKLVTSQVTMSPKHLI